MKLSRWRGVVALVSAALAMVEVGCWSVRRPGMLDVIAASPVQALGIAQAPSADAGLPVIALLVLSMALASAEAAGLVGSAIRSLPQGTVLVRVLAPRLRIAQGITVLVFVSAVLTTALSIADGQDVAQMPALRVWITFAGVGALVLMRWVLFNLPIIADLATIRETASLRGAAVELRSESVGDPLLVEDNVP